MKIAPNKTDFGIYAPNLQLAGSSACNYYRIETPTLAMFEKGYANVFLDDGIKDLIVEGGIHPMLVADICLFYGRSDGKQNHIIDTIRGMQPAKDSNGTLQYPPTMVFDIDDNIDTIHPFNFTFSRLGTRAFDGTRLKPGDTLSTVLADGTEMPVWVDKVTQGTDGTLFDIARNLANVDSFHDGVARYDGATFSSQALCDFYKERGQSDVYLYPNSVVPKHYPQVELAPHEGVRILWQGAQAHMVDWHYLRDALAAVAKKYPQVTFVIWGQKFDYIHKVIPEGQFEYHEWVDYKAYRATRVLMDCDINLAPLRDTPFNQAKSPIKWYEASMLKHPEATLASKAVYGRELVDGETGLLYETPEEFASQLSILIEQADLRKRLAANAKQWVLDNRHYLKTADGLFEFYQHLREKKRREYLAA